MAWITGNYYLSLSQMQNNATIICKYFLSQGWTLNAIAGMLGNMQTESTINPGIWQSLKQYQGGYGLVQWTPYTNYSDWAGQNWINNGNLECERIIYEFENGLQYYPTDDYPMTAAEFKSSSDTPEYLAQVFLNNYERPDDLDQPQRSTQARYWYDYLTGEEAGDLPPVP